MFFVSYDLTHACLDIIAFPSSFSAEIGMVGILTSVLSVSIITDIFGRQRRRVLNAGVFAGFSGGVFMDMAVWFLIGAILVFFMQCGFAMVETGFTRAKNAGNIIMKNLMDFCIGTVMFFMLGYGLMWGQHGALGLIGRPEWGMFRDFEGFDWSSFVFQLVFCATAATIVSGAMAERTKFSSY